MGTRIWGVLVVMLTASVPAWAQESVPSSHVAQAQAGPAEVALPETLALKVRVNRLEAAIVQLRLQLSESERIRTALEAQQVMPRLTEAYATLVGEAEAAVPGYTLNEQGELTPKQPAPAEAPPDGTP